MAAWLFPIVSGEGNAGAGPMMKSEPSAMTMGSLEMTESKGKLPASDGVYDVKVKNTCTQLLHACVIKSVYK